MHNLCTSTPCGVTSRSVSDLHVHDMYTCTCICLKFSYSVVSNILETSSYNAQPGQHSPLQGAHAVLKFMQAQDKLM